MYIVSLHKRFRLYKTLSPWPFATATNYREVRERGEQDFYVLYSARSNQ